MNDLFKIDEQRKSAVDIVVEKIKLLLIEKKLKPGDMIPSETVLSQSLQVGRGSIREAMKILSAYGIIEVRRGAGTFISNGANKQIFNPLLFQILVRDPDYHNLIEIREMMEIGIVDLILKNADDEDFRRLDEAMKKFEAIETSESPDREEGDAADIRYHRIMGEITHNEIISNIYNFIIELFTPTIDSSYGYETHKKMHKAIMDRDHAGALEMVKVHTGVWSKSREGV